MGVKEVVLWKDVIGVANRNPNEKNSPTPLEYFEFLEYSKFKSMIEPGGSAEGLVHYKTVRELSEQKIPLRIKNFWKPELPGTLIS